MNTFFAVLIILSYVDGGVALERAELPNTVNTTELCEYVKDEITYSIKNELADIVNEVATECIQYSSNSNFIVPILDEDRTYYEVD
jgi:hypothetical protein